MCSLTAGFPGMPLDFELQPCIYQIEERAVFDT
jgi:hypothetical protein